MHRPLHTSLTHTVTPISGPGANLCEMTRLGLPVPPGFVITSETCLEFFGGGLPAGTKEEYMAALREVREHVELGSTYETRHQL